MTSVTLAVRRLKPGKICSSTRGLCTPKFLADFQLQNELAVFVKGFF
jgi:hypothetical protein